MRDWYCPRDYTGLAITPARHKLLSTTSTFAFNSLCCCRYCCYIHTAPLVVVFGSSVVLSIPRRNYNFIDLVVDNLIFPGLVRCLRARDSAELQTVMCKH